MTEKQQLEEAAIFVEYYNQKIRKAVIATKSIRCNLFICLRQPYLDLIHAKAENDAKKE